MWLTFAASLASLSSVLLAVWFGVKTVKQGNSLLDQIRNIETSLIPAIEQHRKNVEEFLQLQGLRAYLRQAIELYGKANGRVLSVARVWYVGPDLDHCLQKFTNGGILEVDFCGPVALDALFPALLSRLHRVYCHHSYGGQKIRFWASTNIPVRYTVVDNTVLIAGAPPLTAVEETFGWQFGDGPAAEFYAALFNNTLKPQCKPAEEVLIALLKDKFGSTSVDNIVNALTIEVYEKKFEIHTNRSAWGRKVERSEFSDNLSEWLLSLPKRHSCVTIANDVLSIN